MPEKIKSGNPAALKTFFEENKHRTQNEGMMAAPPLRHAKNLFISAVVKTGFNGTIPGDLDIEKTYQLIDYYVQECEKLTTVEAVGNLMYTMQFDFCQRIGEATYDQTFYRKKERAAQKHITRSCHHLQSGVI